MKKRLLSLLTGLAALGTQAQEIHIIPQPQSVKAGQGQFVLSNKTPIVAQGEALSAAHFLQGYLQEQYGLSLKIVGHEKDNQGIHLRTGKKPAKIAGAYALNVNPASIHLQGDGGAGVFYGVQTLIQLLPLEKKKELVLPAVEVEDEARFAYRGLHLDVSRHFYPVAYIKKYINFIALHKMNVFHWHLTDDQGWRIEIKKYPKLTQVGGWRNGTIIGRYPGTGNTGQVYGGFYTQAEIKEVVQYARERFVEIIPEIEMPGHASAAIAAYPELSCFPEAATAIAPKTAWSGPSTGKQVQQAWGVFEDVFVPSENTFQFLQNVLDEVMPLFPSKYVHIGGDECPKEAWKKSAFCQQLIKEKGLKDEHELQSYFIRRMEQYINSKGKQIIGWDEILEGGLAPNALVMSWRGEKGGIEAAKQKHAVIMTPGEWMYFDHKQNKKEDSVTIGGYTTVQKVYSYEPIPKALAPADEAYVLGAQANVWTEYITNAPKLEYQVFPRMSALSEVLWSPKAARDWKNFEPRLLHQFKRYDFWGWHYSKAFFDPNNR